MMDAVKKAKEVEGSPFRRLVLTSSTGAIYGGPAAVPVARREGGGEQALFSEEDWNEVASVTELPYYYSKVVAERKAW